MQHLLTISKLAIERDGSVIAVVGLNIDDPGTAPRGDVAQVLDQAGCDAPPPMFRADGKVVDVDLAPRSFEFVELIGDESPRMCSPAIATTAITFSFRSRPSR